MRFLILLSVTMMSFSVFADMIEVHDKTELILGYGVNPLTEKPFEQCVEYDSVPVYQDGSSDLAEGEYSAVSLPFQIEHITSHEQMSKYSSTSMSVGVSYAFVSASVSHAEVKGSSMFSDSASVGIDVSADYGRWMLTGVRLKEEYRTLAQDNRAEFYKRCGTEFIAGYRLGQGIRVKMSTSASATSSYSQITTAVSAAVNTGAVGVGVGAAFSNAAASLMSASALEINILTYGSGPLKNISGIVKTESDAVKFRDTIAEYLELMEPKYAVKTHYVSMPYFPGDHVYDPLLTEVKKRTVRSLYSDFLSLLTHKERIESTMRGGGLHQFLGKICDKKPKECDDYISLMKTNLDWLTTELEDLRSRTVTCISSVTIQDCKTKPEVGLLHRRLQGIIWPAHFRYKLLQAYLDEIKGRQ